MPPSVTSSGGKAARQDELELAKNKTTIRWSRVKAATSLQTFTPVRREVSSLSKDKSHRDGDGERPSKGSPTPSPWRRIVVAVIGSRNI